MGQSLNKSYYFSQLANGSPYILQSKIGLGKCPFSGFSILRCLTQLLSVLPFLRQHHAGIIAYGVAVLKAYSARTLLSDHLLVSTWDTLQSRLWSNRYSYFTQFMPIYSLPRTAEVCWWCLPQQHHHCWGSARNEWCPGSIMGAQRLGANLWPGWLWEALMRILYQGLVTAVSVNQASLHCKLAWFTVN